MTLTAGSEGRPRSTERLPSDALDSRRQDAGRSCTSSRSERAITDSTASGVSAWASIPRSTASLRSSTAGGRSFVQVPLARCQITCVIAGHAHAGDRSFQRRGHLPQSRRTSPVRPADSRRHASGDGRQPPIGEAQRFACGVGPSRRHPRPQIIGDDLQSRDCRGLPLRLRPWPLVDAPPVVALLAAIPDHDPAIDVARQDPGAFACSRDSRRGRRIRSHYGVRIYPAGWMFCPWCRVLDRLSARQVVAPRSDMIASRIRSMHVATPR